ncbi:hypothetical protein [Paucibacter soli]|uniref:hypothetical protein n=1 Tax=Paucibacter soli TaxID=3133433 RepID=UPI0030A5DB76
MSHPHIVIIALLGALPLAAAAQGQSAQVVKPPQVQAWIDLATFSGMGMGAGGGHPMAVLGGMFGGGGSAKKDEANRFGQTQAMAAGRWMDVTLYSRANPRLAEAQLSVPAGMLMSPALRLQSPPEVRAAPPDPGDERVVEPEQEQQRPKGRMLLYWGCGETVRAGQPRVIDFATASPAELARLFQSRRATQRGSHAASGRPLWPSRDDTRMIPAAASLVGEHGFSAAGFLPEGMFRFQIPATQDLMPAIALKQQERQGATHLEWQALPTARAYFISAMGARDQDEMVIWTSSEQPDMGFGLQDYQTNAAVDRWLKEQVLLAPQTTRCSVPKGVFGGGGGAMLRMIAYGSELNLAHPPRPSDVKLPWEPQWALKLRLKSVASAMLGMDMGEMMMMEQEQRGQPAKGEDADEAAKQPPAKKPGVADVLKGLFGR